MNLTIFFNKTNWEKNILSYEFNFFKADHLFTFYINLSTPKNKHYDLPHILQWARLSEMESSWQVKRVFNCFYRVWRIILVLTCARDAKGCLLSDFDKRQIESSRYQKSIPEIALHVDYSRSAVLSTYAQLINDREGMSRLDVLGRTLIFKDKKETVSLGERKLSLDYDLTDSSIECRSKLLRSYVVCTS